MAHVPTQYIHWPYCSSYKGTLGPKYILLEFGYMDPGGHRDIWASQCSCTQGTPLKVLVSYGWTLLDISRMKPDYMKNNTKVGSTVGGIWFSA